MSMHLLEIKNLSVDFVNGPQVTRAVKGVSSEATLREIRGDRISMIFQEPMTSLNPLHTIGRQVAEVLILHKRMTPGSPSLGELLSQGKNNLQAPWLGITAFFSLGIMLSLLTFVGEAVRDAFDPRKIFRG